MDTANDYLAAWAEIVLSDPDGFDRWHDQFERLRSGWQLHDAFLLIRAAKRVSLSDPERAWVLHGEAMLYAQTGDLAQATSKLSQAVQRLEGSPYIEEGVTFLLDLGMLFRLQGDLVRADVAHQQALQLAAETDNTSLRAEALTQQGLNALHRHQYDAAIPHFEQALAEYTAVGDQIEIARTFNHLGDSYRRLLEFDKARSYLEQALSLLPTDGTESHLRAQILGNLGTVAFGQGDLAHAESWWRESLRLLDKVDAIFDKTGLLNNLGGLAFEAGRYQDALDFYRESLELAIELGDEQGKREAGTNLLLTLDKLGEIDLDDFAELVGQES